MDYRTTKLLCVTAFSPLPVFLLLRGFGFEVQARGLVLFLLLALLCTFCGGGRAACTLRSPPPWLDRGLDSEGKGVGGCYLSLLMIGAVFIQ